MSDKGLAGLLEEWRNEKPADDYDTHDIWYKDCADELNPFVERLKGLLKAGQHNDTCSFALSEEYACDCWMAKLHALIYGEQPPIQEGSDVR